MQPGREHLIQGRGMGSGRWNGSGKGTKRKGLLDGRGGRGKGGEGE